MLILRECWRKRGFIVDELLTFVILKITFTHGSFFCKHWLNLIFSRGQSWYHNVHWVINLPLLKNTTPSFSLSPLPLNLQTVQAPSPFQTILPPIGFSWPPPPKNWIFHWTCKLKFSSLTPFHLLKVTKFLVKIYQFKFLVWQTNAFLFINFFYH